MSEYEKYCAANPIELDLSQCPPPLPETDNDRPRGDEPNNDNVITGPTS